MKNQVKTVTKKEQRQRQFYRIVLREVTEMTKKESPQFFILFQGSKRPKNENESPGLNRSAADEKPNS